MKRKILCIILILVIVSALLPIVSLPVRLYTTASATAPSSWALSEVNDAVAAELVPDALSEAGWQSATSRLVAADAIVRLIEKASGKTMQEITNERGWDLSINQFSDTNSEEVTFLKYADVTTGIGDNRYDPHGSFTRAQIVTMIGRTAEVFFGATAQGHNPFTDVPIWAAPYVGYAADNKITQGVGGGRFDSNGILQNQHTAVFCLRAYNAWIGRTDSISLLSAYKAYHEQITTLIDTYGIGYNYGNSDFYKDLPTWWTIEYSGVVYVELIDFDNDGLPELLVIYNDGNTKYSDIWAIYGYSGTVELYHKAIYGFEGGGGNNVEIALGENGNKYLVSGFFYYVFDDEREYSYYTLVDGSWETVLSRSVSITNESKDWDYQGEFQWQWFVNDLAVSETEYASAPVSELGIADMYSIPFYTRELEDLATKNQRASDFVNTLLSELEAKIALLES